MERHHHSLKCLIDFRLIELKQLFISSVVQFSFQSDCFSRFIESFTTSSDTQLFNISFETRKEIFELYATELKFMSQTKKKYWAFFRNKLWLADTWSIF